MKRLLTKFNKFEDEFELMKRTDKIAMYKRINNETGNISGYEVFKIKFAIKDFIINGDTIQSIGDEIYPCSEDFGKIAWMYNNYNRVNDKYKKLIGEII